jgi:hypothetical protein
MLLLTNLSLSNILLFLLAEILILLSCSKVMISAKDEPDAVLPPAVDGLLRVHKRIIDGLDGETDQPERVTVTAGTTRLLVPASQADSLIGKQEATIKSIQDASKCVLRIVGKVLHSPCIDFVMARIYDLMSWQSC